MPHTKKIIFALLLLPMVLILCSGRYGTQAQNSSSLKVTISLNSNRKSAFLKLCNLSNQKTYLSNFYRLATHFRILKRNPSSGEYFDYRSIFNSIAMHAVLDSIPQESPFTIFHKGKNYFADVMAQELSKKVKDEEFYDPNLIGEPYEEFYSALMSIQFVQGLECVQDTVDLRPIKNEKGKYKIFFEYQVFPIPLQKSLGSYMYRFYHDRMPEELKSYRRWAGRIVSDTLELEVK